jgi:hypothetical protein|nr:MAG TPA: hypothetical protein [Caudoviricetes sp.]
MNFKEYDKIIKEHKFDMLFMIIYYSLQCNEAFKDLKEREIERLIYFIHDVYLKDENNTDLGYICDRALKHKEQILNNKITISEFLTGWLFI